MGLNVTQRKGGTMKGKKRRKEDMKDGIRRREKRRNTDCRKERMRGKEDTNGGKRTYIRNN